MSQVFWKSKDRLVHEQVMGVLPRETKCGLLIPGFEGYVMRDGATENVTCGVCRITTIVEVQV